MSEKVVCDARTPMVAVDPIEDIRCGLHRQCGNFWTPAVSGDCCGAGSDKEAYCCEMGQFFYNGVGLGKGPFVVKDELCIIEDYDHLFGGKEGSQGG